MNLSKENNGVIKKRMEEMREMINLIPQMQKAVSQGINRHFQGEIYQENEGIENILRSLQKAINILEGKYVLDIIFVLSQENKRLYFNDLKSVLSHVNVGTLSKRLKSLEEKQVINRKIHEGTRPIRVSYSLTEMGHGIFQLLLPLLVYVGYFEQLKRDGII